MRVSIWVALALAGVMLGCADSKEVRFKRAMREIDRTHERLKSGLKVEQTRDVAAAQKALRGEAARIAEIALRGEVASFVDEEDFRKYLAVLREDATALEQMIAAGKMEEASDVHLPRLTSDCALCHTQYRKGGD